MEIIYASMLLFRMLPEYNQVFVTFMTRANFIGFS